ELEVGMKSLLWIEVGISVIWGGLILGQGQHEEADTSQPRDSQSSSAGVEVSTRESNIQMISRLFEMRFVVATTFEERLEKAIKNEDENGAASVSAELVHSRNPEQKVALLNALREEVKKARTRTDRKRFALVKRLLWTVEVALN